MRGRGQRHFQRIGLYRKPRHRQKAIHSLRVGPILPATGSIALAA